MSRAVRTNVTEMETYYQKVRVKSYSLEEIGAPSDPSQYSPQIPGPMGKVFRPHGTSGRLGNNTLEAPFLEVRLHSKGLTFEQTAVTCILTIY